MPVFLVLSPIFRKILQQTYEKLTKNSDLQKTFEEYVIYKESYKKRTQTYAIFTTAI